MPPFAENYSRFYFNIFHLFTEKHENLDCNSNQIQISISEFWQKYSLSSNGWKLGSNISAKSGRIFPKPTLNEVEGKRSGISPYEDCHLTFRDAENAGRQRRFTALREPSALRFFSALRVKITALISLCFWNKNVYASKS